MRAWLNLLKIAIKPLSQIISEKHPHFYSCLNFFVVEMLPITILTCFPNTWWETELYVLTSGTSELWGVDS